MLALLRTALLACLGFWALSGAAAAQRAPIVYVGQGSTSGQTETASLAGGGENSYGYGASARGREGVVIDLRRPSDRSARSEQAVADAPTPAPVENPPAQTAWLERERVGPPYEAGGRWYVPTPEPGYAQTGMASWYGPTFHGQRTASGEIFDQEALTAAHPTLPIPSLVQVTNLENGREIIVRVNDRGPFVGDRLIDLSRRSAEVLGFENAGQARVHVRYLGPAPRRVNPDGSMAPASSTSPPATPAPTRDEQAEEGPLSLLPAQSAPDDAYAPPPPPPAPALASGGYFVQVGAFSDPANAQRARSEVEAAGPVVVDVRPTAAGGELFRVRVGPWATQAEADAARQRLAEMGYGETIVAAR
jgi:rare lipoprotein A